MTEAQAYPLNTWYAVAWSHEITHELTARTLCDQDVVLYRRTDGAIAVLENACWHRLLPLSMGRLKDDQV
jgi:phenylpropionate dioxygenase-like ring-hydroxylating dioxygenase large terminal subunit